MFVLPLLLAVALQGAESPQAPVLVAESTSPSQKHGTAEPAKGEAAKPGQPKADPKAPPAKGGKRAAKAEAIPPAAPPPAAPAPATAAAPAPGPGAPVTEEGRLLVEQKCSKCHDVGMAYTSELSDPNWKLHMKRMANRPGAAITDEQARKMHEYLKAHAGQSAAR